MPNLIRDVLLSAYERPLCANTGHSRTDKRLCEVPSGNDFSFVTRKPTIFLPRLFYFFLKSISQIRENEQKLGPYAVFASDLLLRDDPVTHLRPLSPTATLQGSAATKSTRS